MKISEIRKKSKLSEAAFILKLEPMMKAQGSSLTRQILQKLERGEEISDHRFNALICAVQQEFPEYSDLTQTENKKAQPLAKVTKYRWEIILVLVLGGLLISYFMLEIARQEIEIFTASVLPIIIVVFSVYQYITRNR